MKILVLGAGAVGGYFGGRLALAGNELFFTAKGENLKALKKGGLAVESVNGDFRLPVINVAERFSPIADLDLILICVKIQDTAQILPQIAEQANDNCCVISLQNGVEDGKNISQIVQKNGFMHGIAFIGANRFAPGKIKHTAAGFITIGENNGEISARTELIKDLFDKAGIKCRISKNIHKARWEKLLWNAGFNGISALTGLSADTLLKNPPTKKIARELMAEVVKVARTQGIEIDESLIDKNIEITEKMENVIPSMLQDVKAGRKTEITQINGKVFEVGQKAGVPAPYNELVWAAVSAIDAANPTSS